MADIHEALIRRFRKRVLKGGLRETKSPMPSYRPDIYAERLGGNGRVLEQLAVEAEIPSTLFSVHTTEQLLKMHEFMELQRIKRIKVRGFLLVPKSKQVDAHARLMLSGLFPEGTDIKVVGVNQ
jgi:hypothetical protein